ncbi:hypothetical protein [Primorskyibacter sp. 2E233]|uniref:hypothetical protein n=1 Tax=Primorskyibacter sp. 2E233 TaxID=3413431 RepID=UPI003BEFDA96
MKTKYQIASLTYAALLFLMAFVGVKIGDLSAGLASPSQGGPFFCRNLLSSGGDDDAMLFAFAVFSIPMVVRVFRFKRRVAGYEIVAFALCVLSTCFSLFLASLDCASIFYTAFSIPDTLLAAALASMPMSAILLFKLRSLR